MKKSLFFLLAMITLSACDLDDAEKKGRQCPPSDSEYEGRIEFIGGIKCSKTKCDTDEYDFSDNLKYGYCPIEFPECGYDKANESFYCAKTACEDDEHIYGDECETDTRSHCGSHENNCTKVAGWMKGSCKNKQCVATECESNYELRDGQCVARSLDCSEGEHLDENGNCENNTIENCGSHGNNCQELSGWKDGDCSSKGKCIAYDCQSGYDLDPESKQCVARKNCPLGKHLYDGECEIDSTENCATHGYNCQDVVGWNAGSCIDGKCVPESCVAGYELKNDKCEALQDCPENEHLESGSCQPNSDQACGKTAINCTTLAGWADGSCNAGKCLATKCVSGYHINIDTCEALTQCPTGQHINAAGTDCEPDDSQNCGQAGKNCASLIPGWRDGYCNNAQCIPTTCQTGYCINNHSQCVNGSADNNACGTDGSSCKTCFSPQSCVNGLCKDKTCNKGEHNYNGNCEADSLDNCGSHGKACDITGAIREDMACENAQCVAKRCSKKAYHLYNKTCEPDSADNCGSHGHNCKTAIANSEKVACTSGECTLISCAPNAKKSGNTCLAVCPTGSYLCPSGGDDLCCKKSTCSGMCISAV